MAVRVKLDRGRASLQTDTMERFAASTTDDHTPVWLFLVDPGHLRVFSQQEISSLIDLAEFNGADALALETQEARERLVGLRMRLMPTEIVPERRLKIPAEAFDVCGEYLDRSHVWLEQSSSLLDIYTATYVQRLLAISPFTLLPVTFPRK